MLLEGERLCRPTCVLAAVRDPVSAQLSAPAREMTARKHGAFTVQFLYLFSC